MLVLFLYGHQNKQIVLFISVYFYTTIPNSKKVKKRVLTKVGISGIIIERPKRGKRKGAEMILEN